MNFKIMDFSIWNRLKTLRKEHQEKVLKRESLEQIVWTVLTEQTLFNQSSVDIYFYNGSQNLVL